MRTGRVYRIVAIEGPEVYVGSTLLATRDRFIQHKGQYKRWKNGKSNGCSVYELFDKYGVDNCRMILIKEYEVEDRQHLEVYETLWVKKMKAINKYEPCGGLLLKQYKKQYCEANKEKNKQYREANSNKLKEQKRRYYEANKEKILEQKKQIITCECGAELRYNNIPEHRKTKTHTDRLQVIQ
jgi:hypothetical protein